MKIIMRRDSVIFIKRIRIRCGSWIERIKQCTANEGGGGREYRPHVHIRDASKRQNWEYAHFIKNSIDQVQ